MPKNIHKTLVLALLIAILALFSSIQAQASGLICTPEETANFGCFVDKGHRVKIVKDEGGNFPQILMENGITVSRFEYKIDCHPPLIKKVLALFPVEDPQLVIFAASHPYKLYQPGQGDIRPIKTNFGIGQNFIQTFKWKFNAVKGRIWVDIEGVVSAKPSSMLLQKTGNWKKWPWGEILLPARAVTRAGTPLRKCVPLCNECAGDGDVEDLAISVEVDPGSLCALRVWEHHFLDCTDGGILIDPEKDGDLPIAGFSGSGNQFCEEAYLKFVQSPPCFQYVSGGRTRYIPSGCR